MVGLKDEGAINNGVDGDNVVITFAGGDISEYASGETANGSPSSSYI